MEKNKLNINKTKEYLKKIILYNRFVGFNVFRTDLFVKKIAGQVEANSKILDVGAGLCPYKKYFAKCKYISQDFCLNGHEMNWDFSQIDIKSDAYNLPVEDGYFDYILCTAVLEHLKYPGRTFREFSRVLKKNGKLFLIAPLVYGEHHEPFDYYRFTKYAYKMLAEENSFKIIHLEKQGGFFIFLSQTITGLTHNYIKNSNLEKLFYIILYPVNFIISFACYFLDKIDKTKIVVNYEVILEKE
jgi:ubiquinone/menaquinone biosynthesis C-methylase UbiE